MSNKMSLRFVPALLIGALVLAAACSSEPEIVQQTFATPEEAAETFIAAAEQFDVEAMTAILGSDGIDLVITEDEVADRNQAIAFAERARELTRVERRADDPKVAEIFIGKSEWPTPVPIVEVDGRWRFDSVEGRHEILVRRIGSNELDAIEICRGYVEAQLEYASERRGDATINQYAQRVISTEGNQDGLAWQNADGTWDGPVGEGVARGIADGHTDRFEPLNGYYFKILKGQGPSAPMGEMDFMVDDVMIGGFALVAAPAGYEVTGIMTFIVSHDGVVYEQDLGPDSVDKFKAMETYDPGKDWMPIVEE